MDAAPSAGGHRGDATDVEEMDGASAVFANAHREDAAAGYLMDAAQSGSAHREDVTDVGWPDEAA